VETKICITKTSSRPHYIPVSFWDGGNKKREFGIEKVVRGRQQKEKTTDFGPVMLV
jgi:hypothetical protein